MADKDVEPIIWVRPEVTGRGRRPTYTRSQIARAAIDIADAEGIEAVSMRRVAAAIGAGTMTLYRYVRNKDELYALMADQVAPGPPAGAPPADWRTALLGMAFDIRRVVRRHPWYPELSAGVGMPGPNGIRGLEYALAGIDGLGLRIDEMGQVVYSVMLFAIAATQNDIAESRAIQRSGLTRAQWQARQREYVTSLTSGGDFPYLRRIVIDTPAPHEDDDTAFSRALERILDGFETALPERGSTRRVEPAARR